MNKKERLIAEVNGSMSIEGMPLTRSDKERMMKYLNKPQDFDKLLDELLNKYRSYGAENA